VPVASAVSRLPHLMPPVLTAYLDTNPANPRNQSTPRGYMIWLKSAGRALAREQRPELQKQVRRELGRLAAHIRGNFAQSRGLVVFAGPDVWEELRLQVPVRDALHWGKPSLQQLAWVLDEHRVRGAVLVDPTGARFFRFWLGRGTEDEQVALSIDKSQWRIPHLVGPSTSGVSKQHGVQRDRVSAREQAQRERFASELAKRIARWMAQQEISPVVLVGEPKQIEGVRAAMAERSREQVVLLQKFCLELHLPTFSVSSSLFYANGRGTMKWRKLKAFSPPMILRGLCLASTKLFTNFIAGAFENW